MVSLATQAQPQRTAPFSEFRGGRPCLDFVEIIHEDPIFGFAELGGKQRIKKAENDTRMSVWETC